MNTDRHYLTSIFEPKSVAIIGASDTAGTSGAVLTRNMIDAGYEGKLFLVNPKRKKLHGLSCHASVENIPQRLDLAVICTKASLVPAIVESCGQAGCKNVMVMANNFAETGERGATLQRTMLESARRHGMRLIGPIFPGLMRPRHKLHLAFMRTAVSAGSIGLISQSAGFSAAFADWGNLNHVGFSAIASLGAEADIDFGEALDFLATDPQTQSIFLYIEDIKNARRFMSALRAAARCKPVLLIKVGRHGVSRRAVGHDINLSHGGLPLGADDVFDAALRRAGVVRLSNVGQMFEAAAALFSHFRSRGNRLAIITNGGGPGIMAADHATDIGIPMAELQDTTIKRLNETLPANWSAANPVDVLGDADPARYAGALQACLQDENVDGVLAMFTPLASANPTGTAKSVIEIAKKSEKPVIACWMGGEQVKEARELFSAAGVPNFHIPEPGVDLFAHISHSSQNRQLLMQTPASMSDSTPPRLESARLMIETALMEGRKSLTDMESKAILAAFNIPIAPTVVARSASEAMVLAEEIGLPVAMKVDAPGIRLKQRVGGVRLGVKSLVDVRDAWTEISDSVKKLAPEATINGIAIEPMIKKENGRDLYVGIVRDKVFGPTIVFGPGGSEPPTAGERAVALPPLNAVLVADMLDSTRNSAKLGEYRSMPPVSLEALETVLLKVSAMVCELPWIRELSINPLSVDEEGAIAIDAHIDIENLLPTANRYDHMAIHPYPSHITASFQASDGVIVTVRAIKPEDAGITQDLVMGLTKEARYLRFMSSINELSPVQLVRLTQIDYHREIALIATITTDGVETCIGEARYATNPDGESCEFGIAVATAWQGKGLARKLMGALIEAARSRGLKYMNGDYLADNERVLAFSASLGFVISAHPDDPGLKRGVLVLN